MDGLSEFASACLRYKARFVLIVFFCLQGEAMSLGEVDWMPGFSLHQNQLIADALREVPQLPYPKTPALPEVMPHPSRANSGTLKGKPNQEPILPAGFCDAFVVPNLDIQRSPYFPKRRKKL
jgi:hypothetical protein